ncbi:tail fiber domain-containing protein [Pantoea stewartii]|uniref:tail fiber domain-containing protein n=1 Tax=Pantoea stewartii TaxID=66269 RepID=UPI00198179F4|nr:tail fiber domain-containing protein [Pantoea stewartii]
MAAGTIALTNNSATVNGNGTSFTTELKTGDFVYVTVGGAPYTLVAANITSDTQLTLAVAFDGPTTSGLAWNAVPASLKVAITQKILNDFASVARGRILDFQNWQKIYSDAQSVNVIRPDRTTFTGPSWGYMAKQYSNTLKSGDVGKTVASQTDSRFSTIDGKTGGVITGVVNIEGNNLNIRSTNPSGGWPCFITFMAGQGNNVPFARVYQENSGSITIATNVNGTPKYSTFASNGDFSVPGNVTCVALNQTSDRNKKSKIKKIEGALEKIQQINGYTFVLNDSQTTSAGVIAQELIEVLPDVVTKNTKLTPILDDNWLPTGKSTEESYLTVDYAGPVALLIEAVKELSVKVSMQDSVISELQKRMKTIDGLDA